MPRRASSGDGAPPVPPGPVTSPGAVVVHEVETPLGPARAHVRSPAGPPVGRLVLGHGAGGGLGAPDITEATRVAVGAGWEVVGVEQPWRVAGKRIAPAPPRLDTGWLAVLEWLAEHPASGGGVFGGPLVVGGRSAGARVACRTAAGLGARAVLCLAFPLHPPGKPERSRAAELAAPGGAGIDVLVVQGERDPFGGPEEVRSLGLERVTVIPAPGDHTLARTRTAAQPLTDALTATLPTWL